MSKRDSVGRCAIPCAIFGESAKHTLSGRKVYPNQEKDVYNFFLTF